MCTCAFDTCISILLSMLFFSAVMARLFRTAVFEPSISCAASFVIRISRWVISQVSLFMYTSLIFPNFWFSMKISLSINSLNFN